MIYSKFVECCLVNSRFTYTLNTKTLYSLLTKPQTLELKAKTWGLCCPEPPQTVYGWLQATEVQKYSTNWYSANWDLTNGESTNREHTDLVFMPVCWRKPTSPSQRALGASHIHCAGGMEMRWPGLAGIWCNVQTVASLSCWPQVIMPDMQLLLYSLVPWPS